MWRKVAVAQRHFADEGVCTAQGLVSAQQVHTVIDNLERTAAHQKTRRPEAWEGADAGALGGGQQGGQQQGQAQQGVVEQQARGAQAVQRRSLRPRQIVSMFTPAGSTAATRPSDRGVRECGR